MFSQQHMETLFKSEYSFCFIYQNQLKINFSSWNTEHNKNQIKNVYKIKKISRLE